MRLHINLDLIKLLIFDCDGTLVDSMGAHYDSWCEIYAEHGKKFYAKEPFMHELAGRNGLNTVTIINEKLGYEFNPNSLAAKKDESFAKNYVHQVKPISRIVQIAKDYHGKLPMVVASGGSSGVVNASLKAIGIHELFLKIVAAEDVTRCKPFPDIFLAAARHAQITNYAECLVFEDAVIGIEAAKKAGMQYIDINTLKEKPISNDYWSWS